MIELTMPQGFHFALGHFVYAEIQGKNYLRNIPNVISPLRRIAGMGGKDEEFDYFRHGGAGVNRENAGNVMAVLQMVVQVSGHGTHIQSQEDAVIGFDPIQDGWIETISWQIR